MDGFTVLQTSSACSFYELDALENTGICRYIASTPETRAICNDPLLIGVEYTAGLQRACASVLRALRRVKRFTFEESNTAVLHVLRGGLNFGLREALHQAFDWNTHASAFLSAQRIQQEGAPDEWSVTETAYRKVYLPEETAIIFGDVVATGTSLLYALKELSSLVQKRGSKVKGILFFTIGTFRSEDVLIEIDSRCRETFPDYEGAAVVYLEGRFDLATSDTKLRFNQPGTDLLRGTAILAPEFYNSQYDNPAYPIERCAVYDAGSRAFWLPEYLEDVQNYWESVRGLAEQGVSYREFLAERFSALDAERFKESDIMRLGKAVDPDLLDVATRQLAKIERIVRGTPSYWPF